MPLIRKALNSTARIYMADQIRDCKIAMATEFNDVAHNDALKNKPGYKQGYALSGVKIKVASDDFELKKRDFCAEELPHDLDVAARNMAQVLFLEEPDANPYARPLQEMLRRYMVERQAMVQQGGKHPSALEVFCYKPLRDLAKFAKPLFR